MKIKERPICRKIIKEFMKKYDVTLEKMYRDRYIIHFNKSVVTQMRKMLYENDIKYQSVGYDTSEKTYQYWRRKRARPNDCFCPKCNDMVNFLVCVEKDSKKKCYCSECYELFKKGWFER